MAGVCYLLGGQASVFGQMVIPGNLVVSDSAAATAANILAHQSLYRFSVPLTVGFGPEKHYCFGSSAT
jgi:hypothetical protein